MILDPEVFEQVLGGRDLVGFFVDLRMRQDQGRIGRERTQNLPGAHIVKSIKTLPQRLAIQSQRPATRLIKIGSMPAKSRLDVIRFEPLENVPNG